MDQPYKPTGLDETLGVDWTEVTGDRVVGIWTVGEQHLQPYGLVHGGTYCAIHESAASIAAFVWFNGKVVGVNNNTDFLRSAGLGDQMQTVATPVHRGRRQQLWRLETAKADGTVVAVGQVRLQNLEQ